MSRFWKATASPRLRTPDGTGSRTALSEAERAGYDIFLTADKNIRYQQNLVGRRIALVVLSTPQWPRVRRNIDVILTAVNAATPGSYHEVEIAKAR